MRYNKDIAYITVNKDVTIELVIKSHKIGTMLIERQKVATDKDYLTQFKKIRANRETDRIPVRIRKSAHYKQFHNSKTP